MFRRRKTDKNKLDKDDRIGSIKNPTVVEETSPVSEALTYIGGVLFVVWLFYQVIAPFFFNFDPE